MMREYVVLWHTAAPAKPQQGAPCNGCGLCCLAEPCPLGILLSRRRQGACKALRWDDVAKNYRCGVLADAMANRRWWGRLWLRLAKRWIAAGIGCDADLQIAKP